MADLDELKIPKVTRPIAEEIIEMTDAVCVKLLDAEFADLARHTARSWRASAHRPCSAAAAFEQGHIPYIPALGPDLTAALLDSAKDEIS